MATFPGSKISQASVQIPLSVLSALKWMPLPSPQKRPSGAAAAAITATQDREQILLERLAQSVELCWKQA